MCLTAFGAVNEGAIWIEEYEFMSPTEHFNFTEAPQTITESGRVYTKKGEIKYEIIEEVPFYGTEEIELSRQVQKNGLSEQNDKLFPESLTVTDEGTEAILQRQSVQWTETTEKGGVSKKTRTINYGIHTEPPEAASEIDAEIDGEDRKMQLKAVNQVTQWTWIKGHLADITLLSKDGFDLQLAAPQWQGNEEKILELLHLNPLNYILTGASWLQSDNGGDSRRAQFVLDRYVARFEAVYQCEIQLPDNTIYNGSAIYSGKATREIEQGTEYKVKATVTYQVPPDPTTPSPSAAVLETIPNTSSKPEIEPIEEKSRAVPVIATGGVVVAGGGTALWYFLIYKRKQKNPDGAVK